MLNKLTIRQLVIVSGLAAGLMLTLLVTFGVLALANQYRAADYPGAVLVSDHRMYKAVPRLYFRRDTSYRSSDPFPHIYNWYSRSFSLGPEARAQSACITLERADTIGVIQEYFSVTICDTASGRMMFVQRSYLLRRPGSASGTPP
jgi:hypothetical protein